MGLEQHSEIHQYKVLVLMIGAARCYKIPTTSKVFKFSEKISFGTNFYSLFYLSFRGEECRWFSEGQQNKMDQYFKKVQFQNIKLRRQMPYRTQCKNSWISYQGLGFSYKILLPLEFLDKILESLTSSKKS